MIAELDIRGGVREISVAPNEKIWLVTYTGQIYFTNNIDSIWHCGKDVLKKTDNKPPLDRVTFFNNDTVIMTGYISYNQKTDKKNGLYLTKDGGKTWNIVNFGGNDWIYTVFVDKKGNAWIAGSSKNLYYSRNFGKNWKTIYLPYKTSERTYTIYMTDPMRGFAGGESNELFYTTDNWKSIKNIPTPLDQNKYKVCNYEYSSGASIMKVIQWKNYLVVKQNKYTFYTDTSSIDWKSFPVAIKFFEKDKESEKLYAITGKGHIFQFSSPTNFNSLTENQVQDVINIQVKNESLFLLTEEYEIYKVNKNEFIHKIPYTNDYKIPEPGIIKQSANFLWGATGRNLYLADNKSKNWHRVKRLDFFVSDITVIDDSLIVLWDGHKDNYQYSLKDNNVSLFHIKNPLKSFLTYPLKSMFISSGFNGCFNSKENDIYYTSKDDTTFAVSDVSGFISSEPEIVNFRNDANIKLLERILTNVSLNPYEIPSIKDFLITEPDINNFLDLVEEEIGKNQTDYLNRNKYIDHDFYFSIPTKLDTLGNSIINDIINFREVGCSYSKEWFTINIINQNDDTLKIARKYSIRILPWNLPWVFEYGGLKFNCYNIEFSRYINSCIPENFKYKDGFDNKYLIMSIANYLWNKEE